MEIESAFVKDEHEGLDPGPIEETDAFFIMRLRDPDQNLIVFASAERP